MKNKKGISLSLTTVILFILAILVLGIAVLIILKTSNPISTLFNTQVNHTIGAIPQR